MKKSLLAVAVAAALPAAAFAQTNVTLSGNVKLGIANTKYSNGAAGNGSGASMDDGSSRFIISGSEDLGSGMKGIFMIDNRFRPDQSGGGTGTLAGGNSFVGLAGGFGTIRLGRLDQYYGFGTDEHGARATALQHSNISLLSYVGNASANRTIANASRTPNLVRYDLPAMGGLVGGIGYSFNGIGTYSDDGSVGDPSKGSAWTVDLGWRGGPIGVGAAYWRAENDGIAASAAAGTGGTVVVTPAVAAKSLKHTSWRLYGSYNFGIVSVGLTYDKSKVELTGSPDAERAAWSLPLTAKLGPGTVLFTYTSAGDLDGTSNTGAKMYSIGYDYPLSKRTSIGASFANINNDAGAAYQMFTAVPLGGHPAITAGQDSRQFYVGLRHAF